MNDTDRTFDDLARLKLDERTFAYDDAHWRAAQALMARRSKRRGGWFLFAGAGLLITGLATWTVWPKAGSGPSATTAIATQHNNIEAATGTAQPADTNSDAYRVTAPERPTAATSIRAGVDHTQPVNTPESATGSERRAATSDEPNTPNAARTNRPDFVYLTNSVEGSVPQQGEGPVEVDGAPPVIAVREEADDSELMQAAMAAAVTDRTPAAEPVIHTVQPALPSTAEPIGTGNADVEPEDSTRTLPDTTGQLQPAPRRWHWEASLLGGGQFSTSTYSGSNTADWSGNIEGAWAPFAGGEMAFMGPRFGVGIGLHYATYTELLRSEEVTRQLMTTNTTYSLLPVQVTVVVVVDSIFQGGSYVYVTQPLDTVLHQLIGDTDTTYSTQVQRPSMDEVNMVSYWELPLFGDVHTSVGRWSLGLRGGPVVGFLTQQRTTLPNGDFSGTMPVDDETFKDLVFGWTARAYARYRFTTNLSLGLEPMVRGHFGNALDDDDMQRRNSGWGGLLSVNWRIP